MVSQKIIRKFYEEVQNFPDALIDKPLSRKDFENRDIQRWRNAIKRYNLGKTITVESPTQKIIKIKFNKERALKKLAKFIDSDYKEAKPQPEPTKEEEAKKSALCPEEKKILLEHIRILRIIYAANLRNDNSVINYKLENLVFQKERQLLVFFNDEHGKELLTRFAPHPEKRIGRILYARIFKNNHESALNYVKSIHW
jgi:hypothetical protein